MFQYNLVAKRILVVEDDYFQANAVAEMLTEQGVKLVGPFREAAEGFRYCCPGLIDGAILDVNVKDGTSFSIADILLRERIPFMFLTGYDRKVIPSRFKSVPHYLKPFVGQDVPTALALILTSGKSR